MLLINSLLILTLFLASVFDATTHKIPNKLSLSLMATGFGWNFFSIEGLGLTASGAGLAVGLLLMLPGYVFGSMGAGDTKLMAAIGSVVGPSQVLDVVLYGYLLMFVMAVIFITVQGDLLKLLRRYLALLYGLFSGVWAYQKPDRSEAAGRRMPLAPAIALATCYVIYPSFFTLDFNLVDMRLPTEYVEAIKSYICDPLRGRWHLSVPQSWGVATLNPRLMA